MRHRKLGWLLEAVESLIALHGADADVEFMHQISIKGKQRTRRAGISGYRVFCGGATKAVVRFDLDYPRGDLISDQEIEEAMQHG